MDPERTTPYEDDAKTLWSAWGIGHPFCEDDSPAIAGITFIHWFGEGSDRFAETATTTTPSSTLLADASPEPNTTRAYGRQQRDFDDASDRMRLISTTPLTSLRRLLVTGLWPWVG